MSVSRTSGGGSIRSVNSPATRADAAPRVDAADRSRLDAAYASGNYDDADVHALALRVLKADGVDTSKPFPTAAGDQKHLPIAQRSAAYVIALAALGARDRAGSVRADRAVEDPERIAQAKLQADIAKMSRGDQ